MSVNLGSATGYIDLNTTSFMAKVETVKTAFKSIPDNIVGGIGKASESLGKFGTGFEGTAAKIGAMGEKFQGVGTKMSSVGSTLTKTVTLPIAAIATAGIKTAMDFDASMSQVKAVTGSTAGQFSALRAKAIELGADTAFSSNEVAKAMVDMGKAGWSTSQIISGMGGVLDAASASGEDLSKVATIVADAITGFGLKAKDSTRVADLLTQAANAGTIDINDLGESFKYVAPVAKAAGWSIEDCTTALAAMSQAGIKGSQAGTSLRGMFSRLVKPSKPAAEAMSQFGISLFDATGKVKPLDKVVSMLHDKLGTTTVQTKNADGSMKSYSQIMDQAKKGTVSLTDKTRLHALASIFGQETLSGVLAVVNKSDGSYKKLGKSMDTCKGIAKKTALTMRDNLKSDIENLHGSLKALSIVFSDLVTPKLRAMTKGVTDMINKFVKADKSTQEFVLKIAGIAAAAGPALFVFGKLVKGVGGVMTAIGGIPVAATKMSAGLKIVQGALAGLSAPVIIVAAVIGILVAAFKHLWDTNAGFRNSIIGTWKQITGAFNGFGNGIVTRLNALGFNFKDFAQVIGAVWNGFCNLLAPVFEGAFGGLATIVKSVLGVITGIVDIFSGLFTGNWSLMWKGEKEIVQSAWDGIVGLFKGALNTIGGVVNVILGWFGTSLGQIWGNITGFFSNVWGGITGFFSNIGSAIAGFFTSIPGAVAGFFSNIGSAIVGAGASLVSAAGQLGSNFVNGFMSFMQNLPYNIGLVLGMAVGFIIKWVPRLASMAVSAGSSFVNGVVGSFRQLPGRVWGFLTGVVSMIGSWAGSLAGHAASAGRGFVNGVVKFFTQLPGKIGSFLSDAISKAKAWATSFPGQAKSAASRFLSAAVNGIKSLPSKIWSVLTSAVSKVRAWASDLGSAGKYAAGKLVSTVVNGIKSLPGKLVSIGRDVVSGLWKGISGAASWLHSKIKGFLGSIIKGFKVGLKIGSPSKVLADEVGHWMPPGIAKGFTAAMPDAMRSMQKVMSRGLGSMKSSGWLTNVSNDVIGTADLMTDKLKALIQVSNDAAIPDTGGNYIGYNGPAVVPKAGSNNDGTPVTTTGGGSSDTYNFYSPKPIDEIEAARQLKKAKRDMAEGF